MRDENCGCASPKLCTSAESMTWKTYCPGALFAVLAFCERFGLVNREVRELIFRMVVENPTWGAPRIHEELLKLGFEVSERTVSRWVKKATEERDKLKKKLKKAQARLSAEKETP